MSENKQLSRKEFLKGMGYTAASVVAVGSIGGLLTACSTTPEAAPAPVAAPAAVASAVDTTQAPQHPFPYKKLDPAAVEQRAFQGYKEKGGWGAGIAEGFFGTLADEVGYPFNQIPVAAFVNYGAGFQQASLCGSLGAAAACIGSVCDADTSKKVLVELENWYKGAAFPAYQPENLNLATTVADSILCGDSVGKWMEATKFEYGSPERKSRCAGVTADTAKKMVELLNAALA